MKNLLGKLIGPFFILIFLVLMLSPLIKNIIFTIQNADPTLEVSVYTSIEDGTVLKQNDENRIRVAEVDEVIHFIFKVENTKSIPEVLINSLQVSPILDDYVEASEGYFSTGDYYAYYVNFDKVDLPNIRSLEVKIKDQTFYYGFIYVVEN